MRRVVVYSSRTGNTRVIAEAIGRVLERHGSSTVISIDELESLPNDADLLVLGAPTEGHGIHPPMKAFLERVPDGALAGRLAATFDTRLWWPRPLSGSAADGIRHHLERLGARVVAEESFIVSMKPLLQPGEPERAARWAEEVVRTIPSPEPVA